MKKRLLSLLLVLVLAVSLLPLPAQAANYSFYITSNIWDANVQIGSSPSVYGGGMKKYSYFGNEESSKSYTSVAVGENTCTLSYYLINGVRYDFPSEAQTVTNVAGFNGEIVLNPDGYINYRKGALTDNVLIELVYDNVPKNTESAKYTPVVTSGDAARGTVSAGDLTFVCNTDSGSIWKVGGTPKSWYKLSSVNSADGTVNDSICGYPAYVTVTQADQAFTAVFTSARVPMYNETAADSVKINFTLSNDGVPLMGADGTILSNLDITIPYFDLANYELTQYYRYGTEFGWGSYNDETLIKRPTALHAYIYIIERYYMGLDESECGKGTSGILDYTTATEARYMDDTVAYNSGRTAALTPTGSATSLYMKTFWGHDENLMYFLNHEYPLMGDKWGSTCDYILLSDGDRLDVAMFSNWDFYKDGGFIKFSQDEYTISQGGTLTTSTLKAGTSAGLDGQSPALETVTDLNVAVYDENWSKVADLTGEGTYSYTFENAGTYYIMGIDANAKTTDAHYAPAVAKVSVKETSEGGAFIIRTADDLLQLQDYVNKGGHYNARAVLGADIDMTGLDWQGLGENLISLDMVRNGYSGGKAFTGEIDGCGHTLTVDFNTAPLVNLLSGTVKNLTIKGQSTVGGVFTRYMLYGSALKDCTNYAAVSGGITVDQDGGKASAAFAQAIGIDATVSSFTAEHVITIDGCANHGALNSGSPVGGIVGVVPNRFRAPSTTGALLKITTCKNYGEITSTSDSAFIGGIVGVSYVDDAAGITISDCENHGTLQGKGNGRTGGIAGELHSAQQVISRCLNAGEITGTLGYFGGIAARFTGGNRCLIEQCANTGNISGLRSGGIVGSSSAEITGCYNTGNIMAYSTDSAFQSFAGGISGEHNMWNLENTHNYDVGKVSNCYTTGTVTASFDTATIGAAAGQLHNGNIISLEQTTYRDFQVYALEGTCAQLIGRKNENANDVTSFKTAADLKSGEMLQTLGAAYKKDTGNANGGYPLLSWQTTSSASSDADVQSVVIGDKTFTPEDTVINAALDFGSAIPTKAEDITITTSDADAVVSGLETTDGGSTWTFTVTATDGKTTKEYVLHISVMNPHGAIALEVTSDGAKAGDTITAKLYYTGEALPNTFGYSLSYDRNLLAFRNAETAENLTVGKSTVDKNSGSIARVFYVAPGTEPVRSEDGRILLDTLTFTAVDDGTLDFQFISVPGSADFAERAAFAIINGECFVLDTEVKFLRNTGADAEAAAAVDALIDAIGTVNAGSGDAIQAARNAYDALTDAQKELVTKLDTLTSAETRYNFWKLGDVNLDGKINAQDLSLLLSVYGSADSQCDITQDGTISADDLSVLLSNYGKAL